MRMPRAKVVKMVALHKCKGRGWAMSMMPADESSRCRRFSWVVSWYPL